MSEYRYNGFGQRVNSIVYTANVYVVANLAINAVPTETQMLVWQNAITDKSSFIRTDMSYDFRGQLSSSTRYDRVDVAGNGVASSAAVTFYVYDPAGQLIRTIAPLGTNSAQTIAQTTRNSYDGLGRLLTTTNGLNQTTLYRYDDVGNTLASTAINGLVTTQVYDRAGRLISVMQSNAVGTDLGSTRYFYDANNQLRMVQGADGVRRWMLYDAVGRKVADIDGNGSLTEYVYNKANQLTQTIRYANTVNTSGLVVDAQGRPSTNALALSLVNLRPTLNVLDQKTWNAYDAAGRLLKTIDANGAVTETQYDGAARIVAVKRYANVIGITNLSSTPTVASIAPIADAVLDRVDRNFYDNDGLLRASLDAEGYLTELRYDGAARLINRIAYATATNPALRTTGTLAQLLPSSSVSDMLTWRVLNGKGQVAAEIDAERYMTERVYDANGNEVQTVRYATRISATPSRASTVAQLRPVTSVEDHITTRIYDALNRIIQQTDFEGNITQFSYDLAGNLIQTVMAVGTAERRSLQARYDLQGRLIGELNGEGSAQLTGNQTQAQIDTIWLQYGLTHRYDNVGRRISTMDQNGNTTLFFYDTQGRLTHTVNALGEVLEQQYDALGQLSARLNYGARISVSGLSGGLVSTILTARLAAVRNTAQDNLSIFTYTALGALASSINVLGYATRSSYNAFGEMTSRSQDIDTGVSLLELFTRDRRGQQVQTQTDASGLNILTRAQYDAFGRLISSVDANGNVRQQTYDRLGRVVTQVDASQAVRNTTYDAFDRVLTQSDALGNITRYRYDQTNRTLTITTAENVVVTTTHDHLGQTQSVTDARDNVTRFRYDLNGNLLDTITPLSVSSNQYDRANRLLQTIDGNGHRVLLSYDAANRVLSRTVDPSGLNQVTSWQYDTQGRQLSLTDANGILTRFTYDALGQLLQQTVDPTGLNLVTSYRYDGRGMTLSVTDAAGVVTRYDYDKLGRRIAEYFNPQGLNLVRRYVYDKNNQLIASVDANGNRTRYVYDAESRLIFTVDALGGVQQNRYDAQGSLIQRIAYAHPIASGAVPSSVTNSATDQVSCYVYDADGRQIFSVDALGAVIENSYDGNGNVVRRTHYARAIAAPVAGAAYSLAQIRAALLGDVNLDRSERMAYDASNRLILKLDGNAGVSETQYDAVGNITARIAYATPMSTVDLSDTATVAQWRARIVLDTNNDRIIRTLFDAAGRAVLQVDALGYATQTKYDAMGRVVLTTAYAQAISSSSAINLAALQPNSNQDRSNAYQYDAAGRLLVHSDALGQLERYSYDAQGNKIQYINTLGNVWSYAYDAAGRLRQETSPVADLIALQQDASGNLEVDAANTTTASIITQLDYDAVGNLIVRTEALGRPEERSTRYQYDALGRQIRTVFTQLEVYDEALDTLASNGANGTATRSDTFSNLMILTQYDTLGNAVASRDLAGNTRYKSYDKLGRVSWEIDALGQVTGYQYNVFGEVTQLTRYAKAIVGLSNVSARSVGSLTVLAGQVVSLIDTTPASSIPGIAGIRFQSPVLQWNTATEASITTLRFKAHNSGVWKDAVITQQNGIDRVRIPVGLPDGSYDIEIEQRSAASLNEPEISARVILDATNDRTLTTSYDRGGRVLQVTQPRVYSYDSVSQQVVLDAASVTLNTYNAFGEKIREDSLTNAQSNTWSRRVNYYDQRGQLSATVDALGYATYQTYDAAGNIVLRTEYANAINGWDPLLTNSGQLPSAPVASDDNRTTLIAYDRLNRKTDETQVNVLVSDDGTTSVRRNLTTSYGYDAVGNLTRTTDALGNSTYSRYDRLGRVTAVIEPTRTDISSGLTVTPLTEFKRDAYGNVLLKIQRATGTSTDNAADRIDYTAYDHFGHSIQNTDALRASRYSSYNAYGQIAKTWQTVADGDGSNPRTLYQAYRYDALGRLTHTLDPMPDVLGQRSNAIVDTAVQYNTFGEITRRGLASNLASTTAGSFEYFEYDQAGRLWRSNSGDGVDRIMLYDLQGRATAEIRSTGSLDLRQLSNAAAAGALSVGVRRTETLYDALGRVIAQRLPEHSDTQGGVNVVHMVASYANLNSAQVAAPNYPSSRIPVWSGSNSVQLSWSNLSELGSGDVKVELEYLSKPYDFPATEIEQANSTIPVPRFNSNGVLRTISRIYTGQDADAGGLLQWKDEANSSGSIDGGIASITHLIVYKKDRDGLWQKLIDQYPLGDVSNNVLLAAPRDPSTTLTLEYRAAGSNDAWLSGPAINFGDQLRFSLNAIGEGHYDYRVITTLVGAAPQITATGTISLTSPPLALITTPLQTYPIGTADNGILAWEKPATEGLLQTFRYRTAGSKGIWSTLPVSELDASYSGVNITNLLSKNYEYELLYSHAGELQAFAHATGQFNVTAAQGVAPIAGLGFVADPSATARLEWPAVLGSRMQLRYKLSTSNVWIDGNASILSTSDPQTAVIGAGLAAGQYDVELTRKDATGKLIGLSTAQLSLQATGYPAVSVITTTPTYVPAHIEAAQNLPVIDDVRFVSGDDGSWILSWPPAESNLHAHLRYRLENTTDWIDASSRIHLFASQQQQQQRQQPNDSTLWGRQGLEIGPRELSQANWEVEIYFTASDEQSVAHATGLLTIGAPIDGTKELLISTPTYVPEHDEPAINYPIIDTHFTAAADGSWSWQWAKPSSGTVTLNYRLVGSDTWLNANHKLVDLGNTLSAVISATDLSPGNWELDLFYSDSVGRIAQAQAIIIISSTAQAPATAINTTPTYVAAYYDPGYGTPPVPGTLQLPSVGGGSILYWSQPPAGTTTRLQINPGGDRSAYIQSNGAQQFIGIGPSDLLDGNYTVDLSWLVNSQITNQSTGLLVVTGGGANQVIYDTSPPYQAPNYVPAQNYPPITTQFSSDASSWTLQWPAAPAGSSTVLNYRPQGSSTWIAANNRIQYLGDSERTMLMASELAPGNYEVELYYQSAGARTAQAIHIITLYNTGIAPASLELTTPEYIPATHVPAENLPEVALNLYTQNGSEWIEWASPPAGSSAVFTALSPISGEWEDLSASIVTEGALQRIAVPSGLPTNFIYPVTLQIITNGLAVAQGTADLYIPPGTAEPASIVETTPPYIPEHFVAAQNYPQIAAHLTANTDGSWLLDWPAPADGSVVTLRYKFADGVERPYIDVSNRITTQANNRQQITLAAGELSAGQWQLDLYFSDPSDATGQRTAQATATLTVLPAVFTAPQLVLNPSTYSAAHYSVNTTTQTTTPLQSWLGIQSFAQTEGPNAIPGAAVLNNPDGTLSFIWNTPPAGSDITFSYRLLGSADTSWTALAPINLGTQQRLDVPSEIPPNRYEVQLLLSTASGVQARSAGILIVPSANGNGQTSSAASSISQQIASQNSALSSRPTIYQNLDRWGNIVQTSDPRNALWTTRYRYNANNQIIWQSQSDIQGNHNSTETAVTQLFYDALGRQIGVLDANGHLNRQVFDAGGQLIAENHADGGIVQNHYNIFGNKIQSKDANNILTHYTYDKRSQLTQTTHAAVNVHHVSIVGEDWSTVGTSTILSERYSWDAAGRQTSQINANNEVIRYRYDLRSNITQTTGPGVDGSITRTAWDTQGHKIAEQDGNGNISRWVYNYFGQLSEHTDIGGAQYQYAYNNAGQLISQTNTRGQNIAYEYNAEGLNTKITDYATNTVTRYAYDQAGRHVRERTSQVYQRTDGSLYEINRQDNQLAYDQLGRLSWVSDARAYVSINYDAVGNRIKIHTRALEPASGDGQVHGSAGGDLDRYYAYDAMNRQTEAEGHILSYDFNGNKLSDHWIGRSVIANGSGGYTALEGQATTENYQYDALGRLSDIYRDGMLVDKRFYDAVGRIVQSGATPFGAPAAYLIALAGSNTQGQALPGNGVETKLYLYDDQGRLQAQRTIDGQNNRLRYTLDYNNQFNLSTGKQIAGYDAAGNLLGYTMADHLAGVGSEYRSTYNQYESYKEAQTNVTGSKGTSGSTRSEYDANGNLIAVIDSTQSGNDRVFFNDAQGRVLQVTQGKHIQRQLIANGEVMGRFGEAVDNTVAGTNGAPSFTSVAEFSFGYQSTAGNTPSKLARTHVISAGDTLQSIAQIMYGDSRLWYRIADANAITSNDNLRPGQVLNIPAVEVSGNAAGTFKPYDPSQIVGSTSPNLPAPPIDQSRGCGAIGQLIMIAIAIAATVFTAGVLAAPAGTLASSGIGAIFSAGSTALAGSGVLASSSIAAGWGLSTTATSIGIGAIAGAAGSIVSQVVGIAIGAQDSFSWKSVALGAIGGGVSAGLGAYAQGVVQAGETTILSNAIAKAAIGNALTQGIGVVTGLQNSFSWRGVAAAAVGTGVSALISSALGGDVLPADQAGPVRPAAFSELGTAGDILRSTITGFTSSVARQVVMGGKIQYANIATDAFGNALGNSIGESILLNNQDLSGKNYRNEMDRESDDAYQNYRSGIDYRNGSDVQDDRYIAEADRLSPQDLELARIFRSRGTPYAVGNDRTLHYFNINRATGEPIVLDGSYVRLRDRQDGVTVRQHVFENLDGSLKVLGTDYTTPPEYLANQPSDVGGDPVVALRRQVAVSPQFAAMGMQYIDAGSGQVDPARWSEFLQEAQRQGLRMTVTSNGIQNPYYQGMDNARAIAGGYNNSLTINIYNPSDTFIGDLKESIMSAIFNQKQSVHVAIRNQMSEALTYNETLIDVQKSLGVTVQSFMTNFIGHSQGTINGNRAIDGMSEEEQKQIQRYDIGRYYIGDTSTYIGHNIVINDRHDGAHFGSAWLINNEAYQNNTNRQYIWTDFNNDRQGEIGNNHSLYLYLQRSNVQKLLGMTQPQVLTQPFVTAPPHQIYDPYGEQK